MVAATSSPSRIENVKGLVGLEGYPGATGNAPPDDLAAKVPFLGLVGDNVDPTPFDQYVAVLQSSGGGATSIFLPDTGLYGNGHTMAIERNDEEIADVIEAWIRQPVG